MTIEDVAITALREAVFAIEKELGISPSGVYSDVRARADILETRLNNLKSTILPDGYMFSPFYISNIFYDFTTSFSNGFHFPTESRMEGSLYIDGYAPANVYLTQNSVWTRMLTEDDLFTAAGDLSGDNHSQNVIKLTGLLGGMSGQTDVLKYNASGTDGSYIQFDKNVGVSSGGGIVIEDSTTNVTAASLKLSAQNTTALLSTGGNVDITSGYGTLNYGEIRFGVSGSSNNLIIQQIPDVLTNLIFADNVITTLNQSSSSFHDGYDFTIAAQNAVGFTGGNLILQSGTGTTDGYLSLQTGTNGFEQARIIPDKLCMVTGQRVNLFNLTNPTLTISDGYFIIAVDTSIATTINLPASPILGDYYQIKDKIGNASVNNITIQGNGNLIDGLPSYLLDLDYCSIPLVFNGTGWNIF